jgi:Xaa-Pro aminopeptidase
VRADRVSRRVQERGLDLLLITDLTNVRYLTGFTGTSGIALVGPDTRRFLTDFRYVERARQEVSCFDVGRAPSDLAAALGEWPAGPVRLGFEDDHVTVRRHAKLREKLPERVELVAAGGLVEAERAVKEPAELEAIRAAAALVDEI